MQRHEFRFFHPLRVRWAEVDMQKIVFNAHYLMYFDTAVADYWRTLALPYEAAMHQLEGDLYVKKATVEYHGSARYDDRLEVALKCQRIGNSSMQFVGAIFDGDRLLITGELLYVFADPATQTSRPVPTLLRDILLGYEAGEPVTHWQTGEWTTLREGAAQVRTEVFVHEQGIDASLEWDEDDAHAVHALLRNRMGLPIATGRLLPARDGVAKVGRMAVIRPLRGTRFGQQILQGLVDVARDRGDRQIQLHAQRSAEGFYRQMGFLPQGEPFLEVNIPHITMVRDL
jgi:YbgC/YbaW family acyl-CoA thioester hydrolase